MEKLCVKLEMGEEIEKIVEFDLNEAEKEAFRKSAEAVHKTNAALSC